MAAAPSLRILAACRAGACTREELAELIACARSHGAGLASDELGRCVLRRCGHLAGSLSTACLDVRAAGRSVTTTYSDHGGVRLTLEPRDGTGRARPRGPNPR